MSKKCPPGIICFEYITFIFFLIIIFLIILYFNNNFNNNYYFNKENNNYKFKKDNNLFPRANFSYTNNENDILLNPYQPPLRDDRYILNKDINTYNKIPINISTKAIDTTYRQVGILTRINGRETILPLMGRPLFTNRDKWNFYTMSDKNNMVKLPISFKGKSCTNEYGCDNLYNGDNVYVEGYNDAFRVTIYDNNIIKYIPFL